MTELYAIFVNEKEGLCVETPNRTWESTEAEAERARMWAEGVINLVKSCIDNRTGMTITTTDSLNKTYIPYPVLASTIVQIVEVPHSDE